MAKLTPELWRHIHRLRSHLHHLQEEIARGPRLLQEQQQLLEQQRQAHAAHYDTITRLKLKQREDEGTLRQTEARIKKLEEQLLQVTSPKEYHAKLSEIEQAKAKKSTLEDAILATMMELEERMAATSEVERRWAEAQREFALFQEQAQERLERLRQEEQIAQQELQRWEQQIPQDVIDRYHKLVRNLGPAAFAAIKARSCQSCHTQLPEQFVIEIRSGEFRLCPSCGRIAYPID